MASGLFIIAMYFFILVRILVIGRASSTNTGLADAWDVRRTIESMFTWVNIKTNTIIG